VEPTRLVHDSITELSRAGLPAEVDEHSPRCAGEVWNALVVFGARGAGSLWFLSEPKYRLLHVGLQ